VYLDAAAEIVGEAGGIGRLLLDAQRTYSAAALAEFRSRGYGGLTLSHANLIAQLGVDGAQVGELADRAGVTKQAATSLVKDLESRGFVQRAADPEDRRAIWVTPTDTGWAFKRDAAVIEQAIETRWAVALGEAGIVQLRDLLRRAIDPTSST